jgi:sulfite exporter TauE/SafE
MINPDPAALSLGAALVAGVASSGHCIGMCGGIAGALAMRRPQANFGTKLGYALAYNLSRESAPQRRPGQPVRPQAEAA